MSSVCGTREDGIVECSFALPSFKQWCFRSSAESSKECQNVVEENPMQTPSSSLLLLTRVHEVLFRATCEWSMSKRLNLCISCCCVLASGKVGVYSSRILAAKGAGELVPVPLFELDLAFLLVLHAYVVSVKLLRSNARNIFGDNPGFSSASMRAWPPPLQFCAELFTIT